MKRYLVLSLALLLVASLAFAAFAASDPLGSGVQELRPKDGNFKGELLKVWNDGVYKTGTWITFGGGWIGYKSCEFVKSVVGSSLLLDGEPISNPDQYFRFKEVGPNTCRFIWIYAHPPFSAGLHTHEFILEDVNYGVIKDYDGEFEVMPPGKANK